MTDVLCESDLFAYKHFTTLCVWVWEIHLRFIQTATPGCIPFSIAWGILERYWIITNWKILRWEYQTTLPVSWETWCQKQHSESDLEQQTGSKLEKEYIKVTYIVTLFNFYADYITWNARLDDSQAGIKIAGRNINNLRYANDTPLMAEIEEELKSLLIKVKEESEKVGLKLNIKKN